MLYNHKELLNIYGNRYNISKAIKNGEIYKLSYDVYSTKPLVNPLAVLSKKYPYAIVTMDSAFYYYELTDVVPEKIFLATPNKYRKIKDDNVIQIFVDKNKLFLGKTLVDDNKEYVRIYDKERLLVELIRKRNQIPFDYYKEIINNYRIIIDDLDINKIEKYLSLYKNKKTLFEVLQREVF